VRVSDQLWLLGAALLGYVAAMLTESLRDKRLEKRETATRALERKMAVDDRRDQFHRETLLDLSDAVHTCTTAMVQTRDEIRARALGNSQEILVSDDHWQALNDVGRVAHRVIDDEIRIVALDYFAECGDFVGLQATSESPAKVRERLDTNLSNILGLTGKVMGLTGRRLRELYGKEV
jgi:methylthioribose-1-phosphate isomerase